MNSLLLISPYKGSGFKPILSGKVRSVLDPPLLEEVGDMGFML